LTDARVLRSRAGLRQALLELLEAGPLEQITIRDIAARAGVGYTTYFRHYPGKEALLADLAAEEVGRLSDLTAPLYDPADSFTACLALCTYVDRHRSLWSALLTGAPGFVREEMQRRAEITAAPTPHHWMPRDLGIVLSVAVIIELLAWWLRQPDPPPAAFVARVMDRTVISPPEP
jgi:AcrR family transcriptional regulator